MSSEVERLGGEGRRGRGEEGGRSRSGRVGGREEGRDEGKGREGEGS